MGSIEEAKAGLLSGQAEVWDLMFAFADSMALKAAIELRLPDIIHSHGGPITLTQLASKIDASSLDISYLARVLRLLVRKGVFSAHPPSDGGETLYGETHVSKWILQDADLTLAPMLLMENDPVQQDPWHYISNCVREGGVPFEKVHGEDFWYLIPKKPKFEKLFYEAMACTSKVVMRAVVTECKDVFENLGSLVDVAGGIGGAISEVVKAYPHIKGINFDQPHVVATAPLYNGVSHVGGDMFDTIPKADAVMMKWILHDWSEEDCVKILKNCRKAIPEKTGKLLLVDFIIEEEGNKIFGDIDVRFDLVMLAHNKGGKERTEQQWKKLLEEGGFPRYKIIKIPSVLSVIEAYPM
ncbi:hypothetical protein ACOSP7_002424 [Xanthoceras sorbifolium]|uniref:Uncharacterized protein n=1 Tax=Xanthoceras sorbifolium TaxID=99658 RepID=A0ABQ8IJL1_9ROSI|nr:hypothetical protein JRO89_XS01G0171400 [Xanthoceras sorbifolium]